MKIVRKKFNCSINIDLTGFSGKTFKVMAEAVRSAVKQEHGYLGTSGMKDTKLARVPVIVRFSSDKKRTEFVEVLKSIMDEKTLETLKLKKTKPLSRMNQPVRFAA